MSRRYYGYLVITFMDGSVERVGGNRESVADGVLVVRTESDYGGSRDVRRFPLVNIKEYRWEGEQ